MWNSIKKFLGLVYYVSGLDRFLDEYRKKHKPSLSQRQEIEKYDRIFAMRDQSAFTPSSKSLIWDKFDSN